MRISRRLSTTLSESRADHACFVVRGPCEIGLLEAVREAFSGLPVVDFRDFGQAQEARDYSESFAESISSGAILVHCRREKYFLVTMRDELDHGEIQGTIVLIDDLPRHFEKPMHPYVCRREMSFSAWFTLLPYSLTERGGVGQDILSFHQFLLHGGYPEAMDLRANPAEFYEELIRQWISHHVSGEHVRPRHLQAFRSFLREVALSAGSRLNYSHLARRVGVSPPTIHAWVELLVRHYLAHLLPASRNGRGRRIIKAPKLYFWDTGIACHLLGISDSAELEKHPARRHVYETWVVGEVRKCLIHEGYPDASVAYWRDRYGWEIPLLIQTHDRQFAMTFERAPRLYSGPGGARPSRAEESLEWWMQLTKGEKWTPINFFSQSLRVDRHGIRHLSWCEFPNVIAKELGCQLGRGHRRSWLEQAFGLGIRDLHLRSIGKI